MIAFDKIRELFVRISFSLYSCHDRTKIVSAISLPDFYGMKVNYVFLFCVL